jgi:predicted RNA-binding Zn ribbon-like protein
LRVTCQWCENGYQRPIARRTFVVDHELGTQHPPTEPPHGHQVSLEVGLAFVNTLETERGRWVDRLSSIDVALHWLRDHELLHEDALRDRLASAHADRAAGDRDLARLARTRAAMRELTDATVERRPPDSRQLDRINRALRTPYTYVLVPAADGVSLDHRHEGDPLEGAMARLVESIAREVSQGRPDRLRVCANDECRWVFLDTSRSGRRKWCDMSTCGNRAKVARHRERRKQGRDGAPPRPGTPTDPLPPIDPLPSTDPALPTDAEPTSGA